MNSEVKDYVNTLTPITDFSTLNKGDKIFNRTSFKTEYVDTFDHIEKTEDGEEIVFYRNYHRELWDGVTEDYWYYIK